MAPAASYSEMKESAIKGVGLIPATWHIMRMKYVSSLDPQCNTTALKGTDEVSFSPMECIRNDIRIPKIALKVNDNGTYSSFENGDIAIAKVTPCFENGNICIMENLVNGYAFGSSELFAVRPHKINTRYLFYYMQTSSFVDGGAATMTGVSGLKRISSYYMKNAFVLFPPVAEQQAIAAYLDSACADIDSAVAEAKASIEDYKLLRQSIIAQAVTKGLDPNVEMKESGIEWIGEIPTSYCISRVGLHFHIILGKMLCTEPANDAYTLEPYYCAADVHFDGIANNEYKLMWFAPMEKEKYLVKEQDLLVVEGGAGAGGCAIAGRQNTKMYIQNSIMIVRPKGNADIRYLRYLIESLVKKNYIDYVCNKATIPHFTKEKLGAVPYPVIPKEKQQQIADYLDIQSQHIEGIISQKEAIITDLEAYKKSLIFEVVTGKRKVV